MLQVSVFTLARECVVRWERIHRYVPAGGWGAGRGVGGGRAGRVRWPEFTWFSTLSPEAGRR